MIGPKKTQKICLIKVIQTTMRAQTQELSLCVCLCAYPYVLFAFPVNKYFTCLTTFCLYGNSFLQSLRARAHVTDHGLDARIWCFHFCNPALNSGWEPKPHSKPSQFEVTWDQFDFVLFSIIDLFDLRWSLFFFQHLIRSIDEQASLDSDYPSPVTEAWASCMPSVPIEFLSHICVCTVL